MHRQTTRVRYMHRMYSSISKVLGRPGSLGAKVYHRQGPYRRTDHRRCPRECADQHKNTNKSMNFKAKKRLYILSKYKEIQSIICETKKHEVCFQKGSGSLEVITLCLMFSSFRFFSHIIDCISLYFDRMYNFLYCFKIH